MDVEAIGQPRNSLSKPGHYGVIDGGAKSPYAGRGGEDSGQAALEECGMIHVVAVLGKVEFCGGEEVGALCFEEFRPEPLKKGVPFVGGELFFVLGRHVAKEDLLLDQSPLLDVVAVEYVWVDVLQGEFAFFCLLVVAIHAVFIQNG